MLKKKKFLILLSIITVLIFSTAATCNLCGAPVTIEDQETDNDREQSGSSAQGTDDGSPSSTNTGDGTDEDPAGPADGDEVPDEPADVPDDGDDGEPDDRDNIVPRILEIYYEDDEMIDFLSTDSLPIRYEEAVHNFTVISIDPDGNEMDFDITASHGEITDITRMAVDGVSFNWISPANSEGSDTPLNVLITVAVTDPHDARTTFDIRIALMPVAEEGTESGYAPIGALPGSSGYITQDTETRTGVIIIGDRSNDKQVKGYLSFHIGAFTGRADIDSVSLSIGNINVAGNPSDVGTLLDFKAFDYGELDDSDFAVGGTRLFRVGVSAFTSPFETSSSSLVDALQAAVDEGKLKFQIKIGFNGTTDGDGVDDFFQFTPDVTLLNVNYTFR